MGKGSGTKSSNSLRCSLLCAHSYCMAAGAKTIDRGRDTEELGITGVDAAWTEVDDGLGACLTICPLAVFGSSLSKDMIFTGMCRLRYERQLTFGAMVSTGGNRLLALEIINVFSFAGPLHGPFQPSFILLLPQQHIEFLHYS